MSISTLNLSDTFATLRTRFNEVVTKVNTFRVSTDNIILDSVVSAPVSDAAMSNNQAVIYSDQSFGIRVKVKNSVGSVTTSTLGTTDTFDGGSF